MIRAVVLYVLTALLVVVYVNTFAVWQFLRAWFGSGAALIPWLLAAVLVLGVVALWRVAARRAATSPLLLAAALVVALAGMFLADPEFPAKRVHVPQYIVLAAIVWTALRPRVAADRLVLLTLLVGGLFGVHDEFLQGLHPLRTFGLRDMAVNMCGVAAGAFVLAGLSGRRFAVAWVRRQPNVVLASGAMAVIGLALYIYAIAVLPLATLPYWPALPLLAGSFALACALAEPKVDGDIRHAGTVLVLLLIALAAYPVIANETPLHFA